MLVKYSTTGTFCRLFRDDTFPDNIPDTNFVSN